MNGSDGNVDLPHSKRIDLIRTATILCAPDHLVLHNTQGKIDFDYLRTIYEAVDAKDALFILENKLTRKEILESIK